MGHLVFHWPMSSARTILTTSPNNETERLIYQAPHQGANYKADNNQVYRIIKSKVIGSDNLKWIHPFDRSQDGRGAMNQLRHHYDGPGQVQRKITQAEVQIASLHYMSEQAFSFERFITKLNGAFQVLDENRYFTKIYSRLKRSK